MKRCLRRLDCTYRRARRVPPKAPSAAHEGRVKRALAKFHRLEAAGKYQVWYGDESGFCLQPCLPYLWQKKGQTVGLPSQVHSRRLSVLGFLSLGFVSGSCRLHSFATQETLTAQFFVQSVEALLPTLTQPTVLVLDNATVHKSRLVQQQRKAWKKRGLRLLFLPPYCPHLNKIETLWRMIKYRWLGCGAYRDFATLCQSVKDMLEQVGTKYTISFA